MPGTLWLPILVGPWGHHRFSVTSRAAARTMGGVGLAGAWVAGGNPVIIQGHVLSWAATSCSCPRAVCPCVSPKKCSAEQWKKRGRWQIWTHTSCYCLRGSWCINKEVSSSRRLAVSSSYLWGQSSIAAALADALLPRHYQRMGMPGCIRQNTAGSL